MNTVSNYIEINNRRIGPAYPVYIIAEMSANHNQDFDRAVKIIEAAKQSGADAIKLQTFTPETHTLDSDLDHFRVKGGTPWDQQTLYELYSQGYMPWDWQPKLQKIAQDMGLDLFSAPVDPTSLDFLEKMHVPAHKIASFEIVDLPLLSKLALTGKPLIMSTGMASLAEIDEAVQTVRNAGTDQLALLKCTSAYPSPPEEMNLRTIPHMSQAFQVPVGLSDHTIGISAPIAAVTLGACIIEKHLTLSRSTPSPDAGFSLEPNEFKMMAEAIRITEKSLGQINYQATKQELSSRAYRRSLFVTQDLTAGDLFTSFNIRSIRPGIGLSPRYLNHVIGCRANRDIPKGTPLAWDLIGGRSKK